MTEVPPESGLMALPTELAPAPAEGLARFRGVTNVPPTGDVSHLQRLCRRAILQLW
ncbi:MAG: hypothetical protein U0446_05180 [Dehalococcoidia bacterium]